MELVGKGKRGKLQPSVTPAVFLLRYENSATSVFEACDAPHSVADLLVSLKSVLRQPTLLIVVVVVCLL